MDAGCFTASGIVRFRLAGLAGLNRPWDPWQVKFRVLRTLSIEAGDAVHQVVWYIKVLWYIGT